jgi:arylsulfatase A-like enzyme
MSGAAARRELTSAHRGAYSVARDAAGEPRLEAVRTLNIDALANTGSTAEDFEVATSICMPNRTPLMRLDHAAANP